MRAIHSTTLFAVLTSLTVGCATQGSEDTTGAGPGGKADQGSEEGLHVRTVVTTLGPYNEIRWPHVVDEASDVDDSINEALQFERVTGENLADIEREWADGDEDTIHYGVVGADFQVTANMRNVLSIELGIETMGAYPDYQLTYQNFNTNTGERVLITDILDESSLPTIAAQLDAQLQERIRTLQTDFAAEIESGEIEATQWDDLRVTAHDLAFFTTTPEGITFHYDAGFPHVIQALEPDGRFSLTLDELDAHIKADGLWADEY